MPPSRGLRPSAQVLNAFARPSIGIRPGIRQLSSTPVTKLLLQSRNPRTTLRISQPGCIIPVGKATFISLPWSRRSQPEPAENSSQASSGATENVSVPPTDATAAPLTPELPPSPPLETPAAPSAPLFEQLPDTLSTSSYATEVPERIGFLKELGIEYGYGPTSCIQWMLEHIHIYTGTPWWASIMLASAVVRVIMIYPFFQQSKETAKMSAMKPVLDDLKNKMNTARANNDPVASQQAMMEMRHASQIAGLKMGWIWAPMIIQGVAGYCAFKLLRAMSGLPVPGLENGGFLWVKDLTMSDPYFAMPLFMASLVHILGRLGGESGGNTQLSDAMKPFLLYVMPAMMALFMVWQPVALQLSFLTSMILGVAQNQLFRRPWFREQFNMPPIIKPAPSDVELAQEQSQAQLSKLKVIPANLKYEPPTAQGTISAATAIKTKSQPAGKGIIGGMKSEFAGAAQEFKKKIDSFAATNKSQNSKSARPKSLVQSAEAYEKRRKQERKEERELQKRTR